MREHDKVYDYKRLQIMIVLARESSKSIQILSLIDKHASIVSVHAIMQNVHINST